MIGGIEAINDAITALKENGLHTLCIRHNSLLMIKVAEECITFQLRVEYVALSEAGKEVICVIQLLGSMMISVMYPVMVRVKNIGAIFMASNITTKLHTKHMDIKYNCVNEYVQDRVIKIVFVKSAENDSNILTKNLSADLHEKHSKKMIGEKL